MNRNFLIGFAVTVAVLAALAFVASHTFEIYPTTKKIPSSREAQMNEYLALDRWLESMGHPLRVVDLGNLALVSQAHERRIFIQSSLFRWTEEAVEYLARWVEEGGHLFLALDYYDDEFFPLLEEFGIEAKAGESFSDRRYDFESPNFGRAISLEVLPAEGVLDIKDWTGLTRLVQLVRGRGRIIVSSQPRFLFSDNLDDAPNARLAWVLFAAQDDPPQNGWFFIRGTTRVRGIVGSLFRHGNLAVLALSALVLLVVCFWAVIPRFGLVRGDAEKPGKPLRERFLAEGRFLKRYDALGFYRDIYVREIKRRLARKEGISTDDAIISHVKGIGDQDKQLFASALRGEPCTYREFPKMIITLMNILERI